MRERNRRSIPSRMKGADCRPSWSSNHLPFSDRRPRLARPGALAILSIPGLPTGGRRFGDRFTAVVLLVDVRMSQVGYFRQHEQFIAAERGGRVPALFGLVEPFKGDAVADTQFGFVTPDGSLDGSQSDFVNRTLFGCCHTTPITFRGQSQTFHALLLLSAVRMPQFWRLSEFFWGCWWAAVGIGSVRLRADRISESRVAWRGLGMRQWRSRMKRKLALLGSNPPRDNPGERGEAWTRVPGSAAERAGGGERDSLPRCI